MEDESKADVSLESGELMESPEKTPLDIPLPMETPASDYFSPNTTSKTFRKTVLGIHNAKKRLKGFFIAKKAQEAKTTDVNVINQTFTSKVIPSKHKLNDDTSPATDRKKTKKALTPHEKAKATITEIEELKKTEALRQAMFFTQSHMMQYGFKRHSSRDRRDGSYRYKSNSRRYNSCSKQNSSEGNNYKSNSKSHSTSRHRSHSRNSESKYNKDTRYNKEIKYGKSCHDRSHEKLNSSNRNSANEPRERNYKDSSHKHRKRQSKERRSSSKSKDTYPMDKINLPIDTHNILPQLNTDDCNKISIIHDINILANNFDSDEDNLNINPKFSNTDGIEVKSNPDLISKEYAGFDSSTCSTPKAKISAICPYDSETDSENSHLPNDNKIVNANIILDHIHNEENFVENNEMDDKYSPDYSPNCANSFSPKPYSSGYSPEHEGIRNNFQQYNVNEEKNCFRKNPYDNFVRHPCNLQKWTKTEPSLFYSENPSFSKSSRSWYPHYSDCFTESQNSPARHQNPSEITHQTQYCPIDMGDYDNTKNDITSRELVMNAEPPSTIASSSKDLTTEYEEFMRAVTTESMQKVPSYRVNEKNNEPLELDIMKYIKKNSTKDDDKLNLASKPTKNNKSKLLKSDSSSSEYSTSSETDSSSSDSSSSDSSTSDSDSSDSSSESDSESSYSSSSESMEEEVQKKKKKIQKRIEELSPVRDVDVASTKMKDFEKSSKPPKGAVPLPFIVKQEKEIDFEVPQPISLPHVKIKQEPLDNISENSILVECDKSSLKNVENILENSINVCPSLLSQKEFQNVSSAASNILNYGGETFQVLDWEESSQSIDSEGYVSSSSNQRNRVQHHQQEKTSHIRDNSDLIRNIDNICDIPLPQVLDEHVLINNSPLRTLSSIEETTPQKTNQFISFKLSSNSKCTLKPVCMIEDATDEIQKPIAVSIEFPAQISDENCMSNEVINVRVAEPLTDEIKKLSNEMMKLPDEINRIPNEIQKLPIEIKKIPEVLMTLQEELRNLPDEMETLPNETEKLTDELKHFPEEIRKFPDENEIVFAEVPKSSRSRSKSRELSRRVSPPKYPRKSSERSRRSRSPRHHRSRDSKSRSSGGRSHNDREKYSRNERRKWSPRDRKYKDKDAFHEGDRGGSRLSEKEARAVHSERSPIHNEAHDTSVYRNESLTYSGYTESPDQRPGSQNDFDRSYGDKRDRHRRRSRDRSGERSKSSSRHDRSGRDYHKRDGYHDDLHKSRSYDSKCRSSSRSPKHLDLDNIPLPNQNDYTEHCGASAITTVISSAEDYMTHKIESLHTTQDNLYDSAFYHEPISSDYRAERPFTEASSSPKRISLDDRINMVLGVEETNNSNSCDQEFGVNGHFGGQGFENNYMDPNQYSIPSVQDMSLYPPNESTDFIQTIYTYPQAGPVTTKRRAQSNLVSVVLTEETPLVNHENKPVETVDKTVPNVLTSDIMKCVPKVVKLGGPLTVLPPDVAQIESRNIFQQIELFMKDESHQQRFKNQKIPKYKDSSKKNKISSSKIKQADFEDNSNQENILENDENYKMNHISDDTEIKSKSLNPPLKGILSASCVSVGAENNGEVQVCRNQSRRVKFADGILPGEGTSTSGGEEMTSPPPPTFDKSRASRRVSRKLKKARLRKNGESRAFGDGFMELPPPPPPEGQPPAFLLQPCDIANNAALGYTEIPKALQRFAIFFNSALSRKSRQITGGMIRQSRKTKLDDLSMG